MAFIELEEMEFYAYHGCFKEEQIVGNKFLLNFSFETNTSLAEISDNIDDTINYQMVYNLVKEEMERPSHLLEHLARRIIVKVCTQFQNITKAMLKISKMNPPIGGKMKCVSLSVDYELNKVSH
jgi:7,8-dihydroneopterin aldolase/epimerase/oxygenase